MMGRLAAAGLAVVWLLVTGLGSGCARLDAQDREALVAQGRQLFTDKGCYGCHTIGAAGTPIAPDLRPAVARYSEAMLARWLRDPATQEPTRHMPNLQLSEAEARALAAYLASLP
jgi:mono/diheme cytochrome c family protein